MGKPGSNNFDKANDFRGAMKKLIHYLNKFHTLIIIAFVLAAVSSILSIIAPDHLSNLTDIISDGLTPNISETTITVEYVDQDGAVQKMDIPFVTSKMRSISNKAFAQSNQHQAGRCQLPLRFLLPQLRFLYRQKKNRFRQAANLPQ